MKPLIASIITAAVLAGGAAAGVPDQIAALVSSDQEQAAQIRALERDVSRLERKVFKQRRNHPPVVCRVIAGQPLPDICR